jgi:REP element-mobilizing transposase RayT
MVRHRVDARGDMRNRWDDFKGRNHRLRSFDYRQAAGYFFTICTNDRDPVLGEVKDGIVFLSYAGAAVLDIWEELESRFPTILTDVFVVMPNHVHGIIFLGAVVEEDGRDGGENGRASPTATEKRASPQIGVAAGLDLPSPQPPTNASPRLGDVIGALKSLSAHRGNKILGRSGTPFWQRNYYEHIIRSDVALDRIRQYIANNPVNWAQDEENPNRIPLSK